MATNIEAGKGAPAWNFDDLAASLDALLKYVEGAALRSIQWYMDAKRFKRLLSRTIQLSAIVLTALAGIYPIAQELMGAEGARSSPLWPSVFVGVAAALIGVDKTFGFSTGWARYVLVATTLRKALEEFRLDWTTLRFHAGPAPSDEAVTALIQRAREFASTVEGQVLQETKEWVVEFQSNFAQLEKDVKAQLESLKADLEKSETTRAAAARRGSIELTVADADKAEGFTFQVTLAGVDKTMGGTVTGAKRWVQLNVAPGDYSLTVAATGAGGRRVSDTRVVTVKPGEVSKPEIQLGL